MNWSLRYASEHTVDPEQHWGTMLSGECSQAPAKWNFNPICKDFHSNPEGLAMEHSMIERMGSDCPPNCSQTRGSSGFCTHHGKQVRDALGRNITPAMVHLLSQLQSDGTHVCPECSKSHKGQRDE